MHIVWSFCPKVTINLKPPVVYSCRTLKKRNLWTFTKNLKNLKFEWRNNKRKYEEVLKEIFNYPKIEMCCIIISRNMLLFEI